MKKWLKRVVVMLLVAVLLGGAVAGVSATGEIPIPVVEKGVYIHDVDNAIDDDVEKSLNQLLDRLEKKTGVEFVVVSVESLNGRTIEDYAVNLGNSLKIGKKGEDNGVLLLFSRSDTRVRLEIGRGLLGCLNAAQCGRILDRHFVPYRDDGEYTQATENTVKAVILEVCEAYNISVEELSLKEFQEEEEKAAEEEFWTMLIVIALILLLAYLEVKYGNGGSNSYSGGCHSYSGCSHSYSSSRGSYSGGRFNGRGASR